jgi:hypothetical protein
MSAPTPLTDQIPRIRTDLDLLTPMFFVPTRILLGIPIPVLAHPGVLLRAEPADGIKVFLVEEVRAFEDAETAVERAVGGEIGYALIELEAVDLAGILVDV